MIVNRIPYISKIILVGLFVAQMIATLHVYVSNVDLYKNLTAINEAGYLTIPNPHVMPNLKSFGPAFFGGLFFTLTIGSCLSILSFASTWIWDRILSRNKIFFIPFLILWFGHLIAVNRMGFCPLITLYFLLIPIAVFVATLKQMPEQDRQGIWFNRLIHFIPITLLAFLWISQMNSRMFLDIRDNLLLSNPLGKKINAFYYEYTLYPAEVFKSLDQKTIKTCNLENIKEKSHKELLEKELLNHDYFNINEDAASFDLKIEKKGEILVFENKEKKILQTTQKDFFSRPETVLKEFSLKSDRRVFFRQFTFFSLLIGFPFTLYIIIYTLFRLISCFFLNEPTSSLIATIFCFLIGIVLLFSFQSATEGKIDVMGLKKALESESWRDRVAAVKIIQQKRIEIADFPTYQKILASPHIPERYWLVRSLGVSRRSETYNDLFALLDDPHPNVVCQAFYALGLRDEKQAIKEILKRIRTSDNWYCQWYAYRALRNLGWKQTKSK